MLGSSPDSEVVVAPAGENILATRCPGRRLTAIRGFGGKA
jgi:hypothetical protein